MKKSPHNREESKDTLDRAVLDVNGLNDVPAVPPEPPCGAPPCAALPQPLESVTISVPRILIGAPQARQKLVGGRPKRVHPTNFSAGALPTFQPASYQLFGRPLANFSAGVLRTFGRPH